MTDSPASSQRTAARSRSIAAGSLGATGLVRDAVISASSARNLWLLGLSEGCRNAARRLYLFEGENLDIAHDFFCRRKGARHCEPCHIGDCGPAR
jgi:hypothetical protein